MIQIDKVMMLSIVICKIQNALTWVF